MNGVSPSLERLIGEFRALPGIGQKSAIRLAFHIVNSSKEKVLEFSDALIEAKNNIVKCSVCMNISDSEYCSVCADGSRDRDTICVVENARDVMTFERIKEYNGVYHVLHGLISPMEGITPDQINIKELVTRTADKNGVEVIIATSSNVEGEATAVYISKILKPFGVKTTRLAFGIPVGGELEYADEITLFKALEGRREI